MAAGMAEPDRAGPQSRAEQRNQNMKTSAAHLRVFYCPNLAIRAVTRAGGQRLTIRSPDGSTSTPSPAPSTTLPRPAGRATLTRPSTTKTDVFAPSASTAHLVPRTAAIACGVTTSNRVRPGCLRHLEQQGLVAQFDGIDMAIAVAIPELELRAAFGHDRDRRRATQRLRSQRRRRGRCSPVPRLRRCATGEQAAGLQQRCIRRVPALSWQLPLPGTGEKLG